MTKKRLDSLLFRIASDKLVEARIQYRRKNIDEAHKIIQDVDELLKPHNHRVAPDKWFIYTIVERKSI